MTRRHTTAAAFCLATALALATASAAGQAPPQARPQPRPDVEPRACRAVITGSVTHEVGNLQHGPPRDQGLPRVPVQLLDRDGERIAQSRTDRDGRYSFRNLCSGTYTVCPGTPCPVGGPVPSQYDPPSREVKVPPILLRGVDFRELPPPPVRQGEPKRPGS